MRAWNACFLAAACSLPAATAIRGGMEDPVFQVHPIGTVEREGGKTWLVIHDKYAKGLTGLDGFSHVQVLYWFDKNDTPQKRGILEVHPRGHAQNPLTGVFACRAPVRPNLIGLSTCKILGVEKSRIQVAEIDAFDRTPLVDLKPFIPLDAPSRDVRVPAWAGKPEGGKDTPDKDER
jgi:tRNA-Thr(GGU) m(6)t(6)A37 methyltransferase TsaA